MPAGRLASVFLYNSEYLLIVIGLSANGVLLENYLHIHAHFLAMAELKQVSLSPSGLTKTLDFILRFSRHGRLETSFTLLIWLDENVLFLVSAVFFLPYRCKGTCLP